MSWTGAGGGCPCPWEAVFGGTNCAPQVAGANRTLAVLCKDNLVSLSETVADDANPDITNIITDIVMSTGKRAWTMTNLVETVAAISGESMNDNGGKDVNETMDGKGIVGTQELNWVKQYIGLEVVIFFEDNDGKLWAMGYDGGMNLQSWEAIFGVVSGDEKSVSYQFLNDTKSTIKEVVFATGNEAFFTKLITPAV